jgi:hypothetical protein
VKVPQLAHKRRLLLSSQTLMAKARKNLHPREATHHLQELQPCRASHQILVLHRPIKALELICLLVRFLRICIFIPTIFRKRSVNRNASLEFTGDVALFCEGVDLRLPHDHIVFASCLVDLSVHLVFQGPWLVFFYELAHYGEEFDNLRSHCS